MGSLKGRLSHLEQQMARSVKSDAETEFDTVSFDELLSSAIESAKSKPHVPRTLEEDREAARELSAYLRAKFAKK